VLSIKEDGAYIACGQGILKITALRPEGKKAMGAADFARGRGILEGEILS
jgi:methionyl-tRNA formyltransferase